MTILVTPRVFNLPLTDMTVIFVNAQINSLGVIAVAVTVERGGTGTAMAGVAVDIINAYFSGTADSGTVESEGTLLP